MTKYAAWHQAQAKLIKNTESSLAMYWWAVGEKLNEEYGFATSRGGRNMPGTMLREDMIYFTWVYKTQKTDINEARRFHKLCPSEDAAQKIVREFGNWIHIRDKFLRGRKASAKGPRELNYDFKNACKRSSTVLTAYAQTELGYADRSAACELVQSYMADTEWFRRFAEEMGDLGVPS